MYEAPDRYKRLISARLPGGESAGLAAREAESESSPLRDVQLISRAQLAPFFAAANIVAALIMLANLWNVVGPTLLLPWALAVGGVNLGAMQLARTQSITCVGRSGRRVPSWLLAGEVAVRAVTFLSLPLYLFPTLDPGTQVIAASVMAGLGVGGLGLVVVPQCAMAWMIGFTVGVGGALVLGRHTVPFQHMLSILFTLGVSVTGVMTVARWAFHQLKMNADVGSQSESASLLLQEYEQRGVGWLWQVDGDNRCTYISSRMSALLGRPAGQLIGHSLPSLLGGHAELGKVLLEKQPFNALEMELGTPRGARWISMAGDPIIDTAGRFEGFRGVGSDITEIRQTQERLTHLANVDVLSGLPNRGRVRQLLGEALRGATSGNVPCAIMFLDLDGFKPVNDTFGHPKGDAVLRAVAKRLVDEVSSHGTVGRMGGDEFAIVDRRRAEPPQGRDARRPHHPVDRRTLHDRPDRNPDRGVDRLRFRADRRRDGRRFDPQGRPRPLPGERRRPRLCPLLLFGAAIGAGRPDPSRRRPSQRHRVQAVPPRVPAADQCQDPETRRVRGADPLEPPAARARAAQRLHPGRRGNRPHAGDWRMGHRRGMPRRRDLARPDHRRAQHQPQADDPGGTAQPRQRGPCPSQAAREPHRARGHRGRVPRRQRVDPRRARRGCARSASGSRSTTSAPAIRRSAI